MRTFQDIKSNYRFSEHEAGVLKGLMAVIKPHADVLVADFYSMLQSIPYTAAFLQDEVRLGRLRDQHRAWLLGLFQGPFDDSYFQRLQRIGNTHVRVGLSAHFVYVAMNFIRRHLHDLIESEVPPPLRKEALQAVDKILDLNLDIIARTYHEEELRRYFLSYKLDDILIRFAQRFTFGLNLVLLIGLVGLAAGMAVVLFHDVSLIFRGSAEKGLVAAMGSLLVLWLAIELLDAEIERLRGGALKLSLFVGLALVAFIRKVLVATLAHEDVQVEALYLGGILVLGVIFWLISRTEVRKN